MDTVIAQDQQALAARLGQAREKLTALARDLHAIDGELQALEPERRQHRLLLDVCGALEELGETSGAELFWGDTRAAAAGVDHLRRVRDRLQVFDRRLTGIEDRRRAVIEEMSRQNDQTGWLEDDLFEAQEAEEERNLEWDIEREISELPRTLILPWTRGGEDDRRFRKSLTTVLLVSLMFVLVAPWIELPLPPPEEIAPDVPERVVRLLEQRRPPPPPVAREEPKPKPQEKLVKQEPVPPKPVVPEEKVPEKAPEPAKGILAFREKFAGVEQDEVVARLGSRANINDSGGSAGRPERSMLTSNAPGTSGGINLAALSRGLGGNGGSGMARVQVVRATSAIGGIGAPGASRPLSGDSVSMSRTDEEIQIVFDRYKAALYRLYNRELRKDPTLRGQMVLRLTIDADGSVSLCELHASDMNAAGALSPGGRARQDDQLRREGRNLGHHDSLPDRFPPAA